MTWHICPMCYVRTKRVALIAGRFYCLNCASVIGHRP